MKPYGKELILDVHYCDAKLFTRHNIEVFFQDLCDLIDMEVCDCHFWDDEGVPESEKQTDPRTTGTSAIQIIITSNITIHTLPKMQAVYINIFSCKDFDSNIATILTKQWFNGEIVSQKVVDRK